MRPTWSSAIPSQPSQLASSALVQRLASRAQRRRTFPAAAHSSSVFRTRFSRSGGSVRVWPLIATTRGEARTPVVPCAAPTCRRSRRPALPSQLAHGGPVGDQDGVRGPEEEPSVHDAGDCVDRALEPGRVRDRSHRAVQDDVSVVGHEGVLGDHPERGPGAERREAAPAQGQREQDDLDGQPTPAAEPRNELVTLDQDDLAPRRRRHDALAHQGSAVPFDQVEVGIDLVGSIHRDIDIRLEADQRDAELPRELGRRLRDGHAAHAEAVAHTGGESPHERCRGSARAEPHGGVVLDEPEGPASERTERFRWVGVHAFRTHNTIGSLLPAYPHGLLPADRRNPARPCAHPKGEEGSSMDAIVAVLFIAALIAVPLGVLAVRDRRRESAEAVLADIRAAVRRRLRGESLLSVGVTPATLTRPGRVVLSTPTGYEYLTKAVWSTVARRVPPGYELVVTRPSPVAPEQSDRALPRAA